MPAATDFNLDQWRDAVRRFQRTQTTPPRGVPVFSIYRNHPDAPNYWLIRRWEAFDGVPPVRCESYGFESLAEARDMVPSWATHLPRSSTDTSSLFESWV